MGLVACVATRGPLLIDVRTSLPLDLAAREVPLAYCDPGTEVTDGDALAAACASGRQSACIRVGVDRALGRGTAPDREHALQLFESACAAGDACGCLDVAAVLGARSERAIELTRSACDHGLARACTVLGTYYREGSTVLPRDPVAGHAFAARACEAHDAVGCYEVGRDLASGTGVARSDERSVAYLQEACDGGVDIACTLEGFARLDGRGCAHDAVAAAERFDRACTLGDPLGCFAAGQLYSGGWVPTDEPTRAPSFLAQACAGGVRAACR